MKRPPTPRSQVYDLYWRFASERQRIFERRLESEVGPWTDDPILRVYKFCNTFRASDRVSQYLIRNVAYSDEPANPEDRLFQIVAFRLFSRISTWETLRGLLNRAPMISDLQTETFRDALEATKSRNGGLYTGAFILCATNAYEKPTKHENHVELLRHMFCRDGLGRRLLAAASLREIYDLLISYPLIGSFMAYQIAIDLNYSAYVNFSENEFTEPGPGALRGMRKVFEDFGDYAPAEIVHWMVERQELEFERLGLCFNGLWGRPLHAIDCQGLFCETDKYCREAAPSLLSNRRRIKAKFSRSREKPIDFFFPPKWGLNDKVRQTNVSRTTKEHRAR